MRRKGQTLPSEEIERILKECTHGTLALSGDDGYPYALPISYTYDDGRIIFHSALTGHKIDAIERSGKASFAVIAMDEVVPERYTTHYQSVIAFGSIRVVEDEDEKRDLIMKLAEKYSLQNGKAHIEGAIDASWASFCIIVLDIEHITGKESKEMMLRRKSQG